MMSIMHGRGRKHQGRKGRWLSLTSAAVDQYAMLRELRTQSEVCGTQSQTPNRTLSVRTSKSLIPVVACQKFSRNAKRKQWEHRRAGRLIIMTAQHKRTHYGLDCRSHRKIQPPKVAYVIKSCPVKGFTKDELLQSDVQQVDYSHKFWTLNKTTARSFRTVCSYVAAASDETLTRRSLRNLFWKRLLNSTESSFWT